MTWSLVYVGISNNLLSIEDFLKEMDTAFLNELAVDTISELYIKSENSKEDFLDYIKHIGEVTDDDIKESNWIWSMSYLNDILSSDNSIHEKLRKICDVWAKFNYPSEWTHFIYYMPSNIGISSEEGLYEQFLLYMKKENEKLVRYTC